MSGEEREKLLDDIIFDNLEGDSNEWQTTYDYENLKKGLRIAYLKGILEYNIWADNIPNGNEICDAYVKELEELLKK